MWSEMKYFEGTPFYERDVTRQNFIFILKDLQSLFLILLTAGDNLRTLLLIIASILWIPGTLHSRDRNKSSSALGMTSWITPSKDITPVSSPTDKQV